MRYDKAQQKALFERSKALLNEDTATTESSAKTQAQDLRETIVYHEYRYYVMNEPVVSDFEYDQLYKKLEAIEAQFPNLLVPDSPTQRVSNDITDDFPTVQHLVPMLSLDNSYNLEDLIDFDRRIKDKADLSEDLEIEYVVEPKFDGGSISLIYENDLLVRAATRGNGKEGDEITNNAKRVRSVPLKAAFSKFGLRRVELRGEVIIPRDVFEKVNATREKNGQSILANPRNAATGAMRVKESAEVERRGLDAFLYQLGYAENEAGDNILESLKMHESGIQMLEQIGFKVPRLNIERKVCKNIQEAYEFCDAWQNKRDNYNYEIDGMVVKVNDFELQEKVGYTSHHPRWAIAYKFKARQATTKLLNVEYQVGKIGSITPVAKLNPVQLAGVTVSSVSLHNEDFITSKDLRIDDTVLVERAGDVIPYIVKAMDDLRDGSEVPIEFPKFCPINLNEQVELVRQESEAAWRCPTCTCGAQDLERMVFHVSKPAMNIDGFGRSIVERFAEIGWLQDFSDIYKLDYDAISELEGFGKRSAEKLKKAIDKARVNPIWRLLHSLSIHHVGKKVSQLLAAEIEHVLDLKDWTEEQFTEIKDIGPKVADNVLEFFSHERNIQLLHDLEEAGVNLTQTEEDKPLLVAEDAPLVGKTILFTGTLVEMKRKAAQELAAKAGAKNISAVSSNLNILVAGEKAGSKLKKAQALGTVEIMTEAEFLELVAAFR